MDATSAMTRAADPYRAGLELAGSLARIDPEVVVLTTTIDYGNSSEILDGLRDGIDNDDLIIVGSTGDGCYGAEGVGTHGASAMALTSGGAVDWRVVSGSGMAAEPETVTRQVLDHATATEQPALLYLVSDFRTDASRIESVLRDYPDTPITGGLAADDDRLQESVLYANDRVITDGIVGLAAYGTIDVWTQTANDVTPLGPWGTVEDAEATTLRRIDGMDATAFIEHALGKPILRSDRAVICLRLADPQEPQRYRVRSVVPDFAGAEEHIGLFGGIRVGERVQLCVPEAGELLGGIERLAVQAREDGITPAAALMVSCAGRKWFLGDQVQEEITSLTETFPDGLAMTGFASFGEIGPQTGAGAQQTNAFHNMSLVLTLIGS